MRADARESAANVLHGPRELLLPFNKKQLQPFVLERPNHGRMSVTHYVSGECEASKVITPPPGKIECIGSLGR
ncbi:MAG TPA: hypothetical protein VGQ99_17525, partial [Tepidisphaeraceae bacterium]|nr:hypothetical protein [Tepidisphaeraceae bacterium]